MMKSQEIKKDDMSTMMPLPIHRLRDLSRGALRTLLGKHTGIADVLQGQSLFENLRRRSGAALRGVARIMDRASDSLVLPPALDLDEPDAGPLRYLSLDELRLYVADSGSIATLADLSSQGTLKWDMDGSGNSTIYLDGALSPGNGADDMRLYVPTSAFAGVDPSRYLYLYSKFGATSGMQADNYANASFEEWSAVTTTPPAAEPGVLGLLGAGLLGMIATRRRRRI